jgi:hypothetical protein
MSAAVGLLLCFQSALDAIANDGVAAAAICNTLLAVTMSVDLLFVLLGTASRRNNCYSTTLQATSRSNILTPDPASPRAVVVRGNPAMKELRCLKS